MTTESISERSRDLPPERRPVLEICNQSVRLFKSALGRGPTRARAYLATPDVLVILMEDTLTTAERKLVALGEHQKAQEGRLFLQQALEQSLRSLADRIFERRTVTFVTGFDPRHDISVVVMSFEPAPDGAEAAERRRTAPLPAEPSPAR
jgi:uncharacterized protein YbcI